MYVLCTPLYECVMKKEVQGRWGRVATRCAAIAVCTSRMYVRVRVLSRTYLLHVHVHVETECRCATRLFTCRTRT